MKFIPVESIPEIEKERCKKKPITAMIEEFLHSGNKFVKVQIEEGDYASDRHCVCDFIRVVRNNDYPIKVVQRGDDIYLAKY